jgi:hypothetical protein
MKPGATVLTVSPTSLPSSLSAFLSAKAASLASDVVRPKRPDFDAA